MQADVRRQLALGCDPDQVGRGVESHDASTRPRQHRQHLSQSTSAAAGFEHLLTRLDVPSAGKIVDDLSFLFRERVPTEVGGKEIEAVCGFHGHRRNLSI
jgi:hypothetical protein